MKRNESKSESETSSGSGDGSEGKRTESNDEGGSMAELHRSVGNTAIQRLHEAGALQASLSVSQPGDAHEREAEEVADAVTRSREARPVVDTAGGIQRKDAGGSSVGGDAESAVQSATDGGKAIPSGQRSFYESRFGHDFSDVRVHTGRKADQAARSINAEAFTMGSDVVFRKGNYSPTTSGGKQLLAHELTHVVQQGGGEPKAATGGEGGAAGGETAQRVETGEGEGVARSIDERGPTPAVQRRANAMAAGGGGGGGGGARGSGSQAQDLATDLGEISGMEALTDVLGGTLESLAPTPGDKSVLEAGFTIPVPAASTGAANTTVNLNLKAEVGRGDPASEGEQGPITTMFELALGAGVSVEAVAFNVSAAVQAVGRITAKGDNGAEVIRMWAMAVHEAVEGAAGEYAAECLVSETTALKAKKQMGEGEFVESSLGARVSGSAEARGDGGPSGEVKSTTRQATQWQGQQEGTAALQKQSYAENVTEVKVAPTVSGLPGPLSKIGGFEASMKFVQKALEGNKKEFSFEVAGTFSAPSSALSGDTDWASGAADMLEVLVDLANGQFNSQLGSPLKNAGTSLSQGVSPDAQPPGSESVKLKIALSSSWGTEKDPTGSLSIATVEEFSYSGPSASVKIAEESRIVNGSVKLAGGQKNDGGDGDWWPLW